MKNVQYGCGLSCPPDWDNYDTSPTLRLQKIPIIGKILTKGRVQFPKAVKLGDITRTLPIPDNSVDNLYCSHVLEHLSLNDFHHALSESFRVLKPGGLFRLVMPDLEPMIRQYMDNPNEDAAVKFIHRTLMGVEDRPKTLKNRIIQSAGNHHHLWLWDHKSTTKALRSAGFTSIRPCNFGDCTRPEFAAVEEESRFWEAIALECSKA